MIPFNNRIRIVALVTFCYILLALAWWSILLYQKNKAYYELQLHIVSINKKYQSQEVSPFSSESELTRRYNRQRTMIIGETFFILASVGIGIWLMMRGFQREIHINRQRRNFLLSITHELKTPVTSVQLVLDTMLKHDLDPLRKKQIILQGLKETNRLNDTINKVLAAARIDQQYTPFLSNESVRIMLETWVSDFQKTWPKHHIQLEISPQLPDMLQLDWEGLETVFRNLTENAAKYSPESSLIAVRVSKDAQHIYLEFKDQGTGIPDLEKSKVFDIFYRVGHEDQRTHKGSGLGLYLVREIITRNGGTIKLQNNKPTGCIFLISIPIQDETHPNR